MTETFVAVLIFSLFMTFCFRHFFIQLMSLKLLLDSLVVFLVSIRNPEASSLGAQMAIVLVSSLSVLVFFILMAAGTQKFAGTKASSLEVRGD